MDRIYILFARYFFALFVVIIVSCTSISIREKQAAVHEAELPELVEVLEETSTDTKDTLEGQSSGEDLVEVPPKKEEFTPAGTYLGSHFPPIEDFQPSEPNDSTVAPTISVVGNVVDDIEDYPDVEAEYPGGRRAMSNFILTEIIYPPLERGFSYQGTVYLSFIVETNGTLTNIKIERGVEKALDREAKRVIREMPDWKPAEIRGKLCRSRVRLPIRIELH